MSSELLAWCLIGAGGYLLVVSVLFYTLERKLRFVQAIAPELSEETGMVWFFMTFVMELLFFVAIPSLAYGFFAFVLPFAGIRAGMAAALYAFIVGIAPSFMSLSVRVKIPLSWLLFIMLGMLCKLTGCLVIIALIYGL